MLEQNSVTHHALQVGGPGRREKNEPKIVMFFLRTLRACRWTRRNFFLRVLVCISHLKKTRIKNINYSWRTIHLLLQPSPKIRNNWPPKWLQKLRSPVTVFTTRFTRDNYPRPTDWVAVGNTVWRDEGGATGCFETGPLNLRKPTQRCFTERFPPAS